MLLWILLLADQALHSASARQAPDGAEVVSACFFAYVLKLDMPGSNHHTIRASDFQRKAAGFYADAGSPPPLLEAYWILALPEHFQEAVLKECPAMVVLAYFVGAESKMYTEPPMAAELSNIGFSLLQRMERRTQDLIRESWPIDAALNRIKAVQESIQRLKETPLPSAGLLDLVLAYCKEDLQWLQVALPQWLQGPTRLFIYEKCGQAAELGSLPAHIKVLREQVVDGPPGGRKDECSAYLTHLSKIVTKDVALYTLFLQADALNHVWPYYLHLVMRTMQLRSLDVAFLHLGQSRMVASTSECKRAIFKQVLGREQRQMATGYCCAQFLVRQDLILGNREVWPRALKAMDEPLPVGCEHVRRGSGMHCLVFESIWHAMFGFPESFTPRAEDVTLPSCLRIPETDESDLPDGLRSTFYLERATGDDDISWLEKLMAKESEDMSGARSLGYVGWDQNSVPTWPVHRCRSVMGPKSKKKDPNAPTLLPEDTYLRAKKLIELTKGQMKQPKGELTQEEWCIPPGFHSTPELKETIKFWQKCAIVQHTERGMKVPSRMKTLEDPSKCAKKTYPRKEVQDLFKFIKTMNKQATKRTGQFLKQLEKKEGKETKRETLLKQVKDVDELMNEELRNARKFVERQELFEKKYMIGSKLGEQGPKKNALILIEQSDIQMAWVDETKDEIVKFINGVIEPETETFNLALFSSSAVTTWCPQFQNKADPKKGLADSIKWLNKNFTAKSCAAQAWPPDWTAALHKFIAEGVALPWRIYLCCSRSPEGKSEEILELIASLRNSTDSPAKGEPVLPINIVAFDPSIVGNEDEKAFFTEVGGPQGSFLIDTSAEDLVALDKMLKAVQVKRKQLDKLNKKLDKMEDLSERVAEDRALLQMQIALNNMLSNDLELCDWALKNEAEPPPPDI